MAWTTADIPDLSGRLTVVTGANGGRGLEVARELARKGAKGVMASRDQTKAEDARLDSGRDPRCVARAGVARSRVARLRA